MSPFNFDKQFPTFKRVGRALPGLMRRTGRILVVAPAGALRRRYKLVLAAILILAVAYGAADLVLSRKVKAEIEAIRARGEPVSVSELAGEPIPDAENAAVIYARAFELISSPGAKEDLDVVAGFVSRGERERDPSLWTQAETVMPRYGKVIILIEQAASRPRCRFPVNWEDGWDARFPHLADLRKLAQLLRADALLDARAGRMADALRSVELGFKLSDSLKDEPSLISQSARIGLIAAASQSLEEVLQLSRISGRQAGRLFHGLDGIDLVPGSVKGMQGDRALGLWYFERLRDGKLRESLYSGGGGGPGDGGIPWGWTLYARSPLIHADELFYLRAMDKAVSDMRAPYRGRKGYRELQVPTYALISSVLPPAYPRTRGAAERASAHIAGSRILLALQAYKDQHARYPDSLDALRAGLGWKLPEDPFSGKDFVYRREGNGFLLYSMGEDLRDDGARLYPSGFTYEAGPETVHLYKTPDGRWADDIIWRMDH